MLEESELTVNLLEFRQKSFHFDRIVEEAGQEYALFARTETESERRRRPRLVHLTVAAPREWLIYDPELDLLRLARDGKHLPERSSETAVESAAEPSEFTEQGIDWTRVEGPKQVYRDLTRERVPELESDEGRARLAPATDP